MGEEDVEDAGGVKRWVSNFFGVIDEFLSESDLHLKALDFISKNIKIAIVSIGGIEFAEMH